MEAIVSLSSWVRQHARYRSYKWNKRLFQNRPLSAAFGPVSGGSLFLLVPFHVPTLWRGVGVQNYKEKGLIFSHLRNHHCEQGKVNATAAEMGGGGEGAGPQNLLPQGEAFQPRRGASGSRDHFWELDFYLGLILPHHPCE